MEKWYMNKETTQKELSTAMFDNPQKDAENGLIDHDFRITTW